MTLTQQRMKARSLMSRPQELMTLIEARNPISHADIVFGTGWSEGVIRSAVDRLIRFGVVKTCHAAGTHRRMYRPVE